MTGKNSSSGKEKARILRAMIKLAQLQTLALVTVSAAVLNTCTARLTAHSGTSEATGCAASIIGQTTPTHKDAHHSVVEWSIRCQPPGSLRVRGGDLSAGLPVPAGLSPHARGRHDFAPPQTSSAWTVPACAGKTSPSARACRAASDHPRMRGEDGGKPILPVIMAGSPPHARGRRNGGCPRKGSPTDHPRMRGEDWRLRRRGVLVPGSPPHARGRPRSGSSRSMR